MDDDGACMMMYVWVYVWTCMDDDVCVGVLLYVWVDVLMYVWNVLWSG